MPRKDLNVEDSFLIAEKILQKITLKTVSRIEGHLQGNYRSIFQGHGLDFKEIREYSDNDDVRNIDWNATARTGRPHVRVYEEERDNTVWMVLDVSPSMDFGSFFSSKRDVMVKFAALIGYLAYKKGDKTGAILFDEGIKEIIPPEKGIKQVYRIIKQLLDYKPDESKENIEGFSSLAKLIGSKKSVFFMSDFIYSNHDWKSHLGEIGMKNELTIVQVVDPVEEKLPDVGYINLYDPETGREIAFDTSNKEAVRRYQELIDEENAKINEVFSTLCLKPVKIYTNSDIAEVLINYSGKVPIRR